ncbi:DUF72 domain-containing protein [Patescibacteria group bacterium]|nr:DUF72 domain-containing protein [Patescibacteria group bacterium]
MNKGKIYIGTSGWVYRHWENIFYPESLSSKDKLKYFSQHLKTTEVNYSFYRLPRPSTYQNWYSQTPGDFLFTVKASRFITHIKRLKDVKEPWKIFIKNALNLKEKLGPILFQFPPSFKATEENIKRLEEFLKFIRKNNKKLRFAFEFRHKTWCEEKIYKLLKKHRVAWVIADSPSFPRAEKITADFVYIRMHGSKVLFSSKYTKKELKDLAEKIKKWKRNKDVFVYFNNDAHGHAIENAKTLRGFLGK